MSIVEKERDIAMHAVGSQTAMMDRDSTKQVKELVGALKSKANKWKQRCKSLRSAYSTLRTKTAENEAILKVHNDLFFTFSISSRKNYVLANPTGNSNLKHTLWKSSVSNRSLLSQMMEMYWKGTLPINLLNWIVCTLLKIQDRTLLGTMLS